jgi:hypothetical protein
MDFRPFFGSILCWLCCGELLTPVAIAAEELTAKEFLASPLAKSAPPVLRELIERGNVTLKFVTAEELPPEEWGRCDFHLSFCREFRFDSRSIMKRGKRLGRVEVTSMKCDIQVTHHVRLRDTFLPPKTWDNTLTRHEFDHVAIGCDPRPVLLLKYLAEHLPVIERPILRRDEATLSTLAGQWINEELDRRESAVTELIRQCNRRLDQQSDHGMESLADRTAFFAHLYTKGHLADEKFPFLDAAMRVFEKPEFVPAGR